jgi:DNA-binding NarL/FixJ family response regulator
MPNTPPGVPTERETAVLKLVCEGKSTKEIAGQLGISFKTVACHRCHLMAKANTDNAVLLLRWALLNGYVTVGFATE